MFRHIQGLCLFQQVRSEMALGFPYGAISSGFVCSDMFYFGIIISLQRGLKYSPKTSIFSPPSAYSLSKPHYCWYIKIKYTPDFIWISSVFHPCPLSPSGSSAGNHTALGCHVSIASSGCDHFSVLFSDLMVWGEYWPSIL